MEPLTIGPWRNSSKPQDANQSVIYRVLLLFLVQLLFGTIPFRNPKALLNVLIHLFYLFNFKRSLKC